MEDVKKMYELPTQSEKDLDGSPREEEKLNVSERNTLYAV